MFRRMFQFSSGEKVTPMTGRNGSTVHTMGMAGLSSALQREAERPGTGFASEGMSAEPTPF